MKTLFLIIIFLFSSNLISQINCADYKSGRFEYHRPNLKGNYVVERNDSIQIEYDLILDTKSVFKINWISDCEYDLTFIKGTKPPLIKNLFVDDFRIKIYSTEDDNYSFMIIMEENTILDSGRLFRLD